MNDDLCHSLTQTTTFSTDFETLHENRIITLNQVDASIELLGYFSDSTVMPQKYEDNLSMCKMLQSSLKVFHKLFKLVFCSETNSIITTSESFINKQLISVIEQNIFYLTKFKRDFVTNGEVSNHKLLDVLCRVCQKLKRTIEWCLVYKK